MKNVILVLAGMMTAVPMAQANDTRTLGATIESATQIASNHQGVEAFIGGSVEIDQSAGKISLYPANIARTLIFSITGVTVWRSGAITYEGISKVMGSNWQVHVTDFSRTIRPAVCRPEYPRKPCMPALTRIELRTLTMTAPDPTDHEPHDEVSIFEASPLEVLF